MSVVVSPYHLTTREPVAIASLLLAERVVTLMPAPFRTLRPEDLRAAAASLPRYRKFVESWQWTEALWQSGGIVSSVGDTDGVDEVRRVCADLLTGEHAALMPLMRGDLFDDEREYLDAVAADVLKGGPDPGICVPLSAGLDRLGTRHGLMVARSPAVSVAQRAEEAMGKRLFAFSAPVLTQGSGELLVDVREDAAEMLDPLRSELAEIAEMTADGRIDDGDAVGVQARRIAEAARDVNAELGELMEQAVGSSDRDDVRAIAGVATVMGLLLPVDAVLRSSSRAAQAMIGRAVADEVAAVNESRLPVLADPLAGGRFVGLVVKVVGGRSGEPWK
ncbi:MAG: hypothetical protein IT435_15330 [Phycisphaerales bacterium]|nr:hypothetical protein [Phycisphaerales bacterium]